MHGKNFRCHLIEEEKMKMIRPIQKNWICRLSNISAAIFLIIFLTVVAEPPALASVSFIGEFSNVRLTKEHAYGYVVQLWHEGDILFGLFSVYDGQAEDAATGLIKDALFDAASGKISFNVKFSASGEFIGKKLMPSQDLFNFEGELHQSSLSGKLTHMDERQNRLRSVEQVRFIKTHTESMINATSFNEWRKNAERALRNKW
jgi:hypothetical protein